MVSQAFNGRWPNLSSMAEKDKRCLCSVIFGFDRQGVCAASPLVGAFGTFDGCLHVCRSRLKCHVGWRRPSTTRGDAARLGHTSVACLLLIVAWLVITASASAQDTRTGALCSPVVERTQGNVTLTFNGGCTVGITPAELKDIIDSVLARRAIPPELLDRYEMVSRAFNVSDTALTTFFRILGENKVPLEDLDATLRQIAGRHLTLLKQAELSTDNDPQVAALRKQAVTAIEAGDYVGAEGFLQRAFDTSLVASRQIQDAANKRLLSAAKIRAQLGELKVTQLRYAAAVRDFQEAANLVPSEEPLVRSDYLNRLGLAAYRVGDYPLAEAACVEALSIRERMLDPEHLDLAVSLNNLAELYRDQGRYDEAEPLVQRALAISEKVLGPQHQATNSLRENLHFLHDHLARSNVAATGARPKPLKAKSLRSDSTVVNRHDARAARLNRR
jgi:tetratricopeptide (TPR) repeat protein